MKLRCCFVMSVVEVEVLSKLNLQYHIFAVIKKQSAITKGDA